MWTWGEAGEQAIYGILTVFIILILLTYLTRLSGIIVARIDKANASKDAGKDDSKKAGG